MFADEWSNQVKGDITVWPSLNILILRKVGKRATWAEITKNLTEKKENCCKNEGISMAEVGMYKNVFWFSVRIPGRRGGGGEWFCRGSLQRQKNCWLFSGVDRIFEQLNISSCDYYV